MKLFLALLAAASLAACTSVATKKIDPRRQDPQTIDKLIAERVGGTLTYWDGLTHQHAFALPKFLREAIDAETRVSTDANPLIFS